MSARNVILLIVGPAGCRERCLFHPRRAERPAGRNRWSSRRPRRRPSADSMILVAAADLPTGTLLKLEEHLKWQAWPQNVMTPTFFAQTEGKVEDLCRRRSCAAASPSASRCRPSMVVKPGERGFLAAVLKPGMRAISVGVGDVTGIARLMLPGDRVRHAAHPDIAGRIQHRETSKYRPPRHRDGAREHPHSGRRPDARRHQGTVGLRQGRRRSRSRRSRPR